MSEFNKKFNLVRGEDTDRIYYEHDSPEYPGSCSSQKALFGMAYNLPPMTHVELPATLVHRAAQESIHSQSTSVREQDIQALIQYTLDRYHVCMNCHASGSLYTLVRHHE